MKERPLLFSAPMVRATLECLKQQTRRTRGFEAINKSPGDWSFEGLKQLVNSAGEQLGLVAFFRDLTETIPGPVGITCPYGQPGEGLWVRETWMPDAPRDGSWCDTEFYGQARSPLAWIPERFRKPGHCLFRASWDGPEMVGWKPSIHMPRWASRINLEVTGVRVERLQDISEADARAEGVESKIEDGYGCWENYLLGPGEGVWCDSARASFHTLWDSLNFERAPWESNPWLWVVEFKKLA